MLYIYIFCTSSTAQGGGGSFKSRKPIGEVGCCESRMAERSHWCTDRWLRSPLFLSLSLSFSLLLSVSLCFFLFLWLSTCLPTYLSTYLPIYLSMYLSIYLSLYLPIYLSTYLPIYLSTYLPIYLSTYLSIYLSTYLPIYLSIYLSTYLFTYLSIFLSIYLSIYLSTYLPIYLSTYLPTYLSISLSLSLYLSISLSLYLSISLSLYLSISLSLYLSISLSLYLSISLSRYLSISLSFYLSISLPVWLSIYLSICKLEKEAILRDFLNFWTKQRQKRNKSARLLHFLNLTTSTARLLQFLNLTTSKIKQFCETSFKMESWVQRWQPRTNAFCDFSTPPVYSKNWCQVIRSAAPVTQNHLSKPTDLMLQNACRSSSNVPLLPSFLEMLQNPHVLLTFDNVHNPLRLPRETTSEPPKVVRTPGVFNMLTSKCASRQNGLHFFDIWTSKSAPYPSVFYTFDFEMCFAPQRRALFRHRNF